MRIKFLLPSYIQMLGLRPLLAVLFFLGLSGFLTYRGSSKTMQTACLIEGAVVTFFCELMWRSKMGLLAAMVEPVSHGVILGVLLGWLAKYIVKRVREKD